MFSKLMFFQNWLLETTCPHKQTIITSLKKYNQQLKLRNIFIYFYKNNICIHNFLQ